MNAHSKTVASQNYRCKLFQWLIKNCYVKDTDERGGDDGTDCANRDGLLSILQVTRAVGTSHDTCLRQLRHSQV